VTVEISETPMTANQLDSSPSVIASPNLKNESAGGLTEKKKEK